MAKSDIQDHLTPSVLNDDEMEFVVELCSIRDDLVRVHFQSRHSNQKYHIATVQFDVMKENPICDYYCTCTSGAREVGCCVHVAAILWHLGVQRGKIDQKVHPLSAIKLLQAVNNSIRYSQFDNETDDDDEDDDVQYAVNHDNIDSNNESDIDSNNSNIDSDEF